MPRSLFQRLTGMFAGQSPALTQQEKDDQALATRQCPDCHSKKLLVGPEGGACINIACDECHSEFNILNMFGDLRLINRLGKLTRDRANLYGIELSSVF